MTGDTGQGGSVTGGGGTPSAGAGGAWASELHEGDAAVFHARAVEVPARRSLWWSIVDRPALVLGSSQPLSAVDPAALEAAGVELVRRRSGGGAVLLMPGEVVWADVVVPAGDPVWDDDIGRAAHWLGEAWAGALADCGVPGGEVHRGPMIRTEWSAVVCFAGLGPGEVRIGGRKAVGISQRRTRDWARFQCAAYRRWDAAALVGLLAGPQRPSPAELADLVQPVPVGEADLRAALLARLP